MGLLTGNGAVFFHRLVDADHKVLEETGGQIKDIEVLRIQPCLFILFLEDAIKYLQFQWI